VEFLLIKIFTINRMPKTRKNKKNGGGWFSPFFGITYTNDNLKKATSTEASFAVKQIQGVYDKSEMEGIDAEASAMMMASPKYASLEKRYKRLINDQKNIITKYREYLSKIKNDIKIKIDKESASIVKELKNIQDEQAYIKNKALLTILKKDK